MSWTYMCILEKMMMQYQNTVFLLKRKILSLQAAAKDLLLTLAEQNKQQAKLQAEATKLLKKGGLPQETAVEVFKQALGFKRRSTAISDELYEQCHNEAEVHLILCLGVRVLEEAKAWRLREKLQPKKGEFKDINPRTFMELAKQFNLAPTTVNRNYDEAISYHKLRKPKSPKRKPDEKQTDQVKEAVEISKTPSAKTSSDAGSDREHSSDQDTEIVQLGGEVPKVLLVLKQEPVEQKLHPESESQ